MKADGGDFDASNPGAGREADRKFYFLAIKRNEKLICDRSSRR